MNAQDRSRGIEQPKMYSEDECVMILNRLIDLGYDIDADGFNDLTIWQADKLSRGITD